MKPFHLIKRALGSFSQSPPSTIDVAIVSEVLNAAELVVWSEMQHRDQRHSIAVLDRFDASAPALLHDVGKNVSGLGFVSRVMATLVGPKGQRFSEYHKHEKLGAEMLLAISDPRTVELVRGAAVDDVSLLLRAADDI